MPENAQPELVSAEAEGLRQPPKKTGPDIDIGALRARAAELSRTLAWIPGQPASRPFRSRCRALSHALKPLLAALESPAPKTVSDDFRWLYDNLRLLESELEDVCEILELPDKIPLVRLPDGNVSPRIAAIAEDFLTGTAYQFGGPAFSAYVQAFQEVMVLKMVELWRLAPVLKLVLLEQIATRGCRLLEDPSGTHGVDVPVRNLREIAQTGWKDILEPLILFDQILREDPAGAYPRMDYDSRELYRKKLVKIADYSDCTEMEVANEALALAREAQEQPNPRVTRRASHVGSYLLAEGAPALEAESKFSSTGCRAHARFFARPPG